MRKEEKEMIKEANNFSTKLQEEWNKMMQKEEEEIPKPLPPLLPLPLEFCSPPWFDYNCHRNERVTGEICWHHGRICLPVRCTIRRQSLEELEELNLVAEKLEEEEKEENEEELQKERGRYIKISALREKQWEEGLKEKKQEEEEERKFMRRKRRYKRKNKYARRIKLGKRRFTSEDFLQLADPKRPNANDTSTRFWTFVEDVKAYNLPDLLSGKTTHKDYLINNKGVQVDIKQQLSGKYILLYFWFLPNDSHTKSRLRPKPPQRLHGYLEELYTIYRPKEEFEIVLVPLGENEIFFRHLFSLMPWLAIPHEDKEARDFFIKEFNIPYPSQVKAVLFAPDGTVVDRDAERSVCCYGVHGFPYTRQKISSLLEECHALQDELFLKEKIPPLTELLGNHVISSHGNKEPTSKLDGKTVGLYFFEPTPVGFR